MPKNQMPSHDPLNVGARPSGYRMFSDSQLAEIHHASLEILRRTGVRVYESESLTLLQEAGAIVSDENLVKFPPAVVEQALSDAPSRIVLCDRNGCAQLYLEGHRTYFGTGSDLPNFLDLETGERRLSRLTDVADMARLADALPNLDFIMSMALPSTWATKAAVRHSTWGWVRGWLPRPKQWRSKLATAILPLSAPSARENITPNTASLLMGCT